MMIGYQVSKRYEDLWQIIGAGAEVIAYIKCNEDKRSHTGEVCTMKMEGNFMQARSEETMYFMYNMQEGKEKFINKCHDYKVEFLPPSMGINK